MTAADRPTVPHPDLDTLADLDAGALDPAAAEDVAAHVGDCARCAAVLAAFDTVRADLLALPAPQMPAPVAARLDAVFADLRRQATGPAPIAAAPAQSHPQPPQPPQPPQSPPPPGFRPGPAQDRPGPQPADQQQGRPRPVADLGAARDRKRRSLKISTGAVAAAFVLVAAGASVAALVSSSTRTGGGSTAAGSLPNEAAPQTAAGTPPPSIDVGIPAYTKQTLQGAISSITRDSAVTDITRLGETGPGGVMADTGRRQACEKSITKATGLLTAVRRIEYEGTPAYVFVFTETSGRRNAWVVDTSCGISGSLPATVLDSVS